MNCFLDYFKLKKDQKKDVKMNNTCLSVEQQECHFNICLFTDAKTGQYSRFLSNPVMYLSNHRCYWQKYTNKMKVNPRFMNIQCETTDYEKDLLLTPGRV